VVDPMKYIYSCFKVVYTSHSIITQGIKLNGFTREAVHLTGYVGQRIT